MIKNKLELYFIVLFVLNINIQTRTKFDTYRDVIYNNS